MRKCVEKLMKLLELKGIRFEDIFYSYIIICTFKLLHLIRLTKLSFENMWMGCGNVQVDDTFGMRLNALVPMPLSLPD